MMQHPQGRCERCGERLFAEVEGGYRCRNCGVRYSGDYFETVRL